MGLRETLNEASARFSGWLGKLGPETENIQGPDGAYEKAIGLATDFCTRHSIDMEQLKKGSSPDLSGCNNNAQHVLQKLDNAKKVEPREIAAAIAKYAKYGEALKVQAERAAIDITEISDDAKLTSLTLVQRLINTYDLKVTKEP